MKISANGQAEQENLVHQQHQFTTKYKLCSHYPAVLLQDVRFACWYQRANLGIQDPVLKKTALHLYFILQLCKE